MVSEPLVSIERLSLAIRDDPNIRGRQYALVKKHINEATVVDAVEVVRCKECKHYAVTPSDCVPYCSHESGYVGEYIGNLFYCANGERKAEDGN